jgi:hypothetical protein
MRSKRLAWVLVALVGLTLLAGTLPCFGDGEGTQTDPGDPWSEPPNCDPLDPTPRILGDFWMILMAMAFQLAL